MRVDDMYLNEKVATKFAEVEQNERGKAVADVVDKIAMHELKDFGSSLYVADLFAGAHPDRYHLLFDQLLKEDGKIDWVDVSPVMMKLAKKYLEDEGYQNRFNVINFVEKDAIEYLETLSSELNLILIKYSIDFVSNLDNLFSLVPERLIEKGSLIATLTTASPILKSVSTSARYLYQGKEFPLDETRTLEEGESFGIKFFNESGNPDSGYIEGAETTKYYHSLDKIKSVAKKYNLEVYVGDWKDYLPEDERQGNNIDQEVLILKKK
jgi:ubiquinone/menaquinone biosynthesis C-methylase UbiE